MSAASVISALVTVHLPLREVDGAEREDDPERLIADAREGFAQLRREPGALMLSLLVGAQFVVIGALDVLYTVTAIDVLDMGESGHRDPGLGRGRGRGGGRHRHRRPGRAPAHEPGARRRDHRHGDPARAGGVRAGASVRVGDAGAERRRQGVLRRGRPHAPAADRPRRGARADLRGAGRPADGRVGARFDRGAGVGGALRGTRGLRRRRRIPAPARCGLVGTAAAHRGRRRGARAGARGAAAHPVLPAALAAGARALVMEPRTRHARRRDRSSSTRAIPAIAST